MEGRFSFVPFAAVVVLGFFLAKIFTKKFQCEYVKAANWDHLLFVLLANVHFRGEFNNVGHVSYQKVKFSYLKFESSLSKKIPDFICSVNNMLYRKVNAWKLYG